MEEFITAQDAFEFYYDKILKDGELRGYDDNETMRLKTVMFRITNPMDMHIHTPFRAWTPKYAEAEWLWYLSGNRSVKELKKIAPIWDNMHNGNDLVNSNYGYQWNRKGQLNNMIDRLKRNPMTRQATITINDGKDWIHQGYDTPCTQTIMFDVDNNNSLDMTVIMRSNDLWYGFTNDQYTFSKLFLMVANEIGCDVGTYTHMANDLHLYRNKFNKKRDYEK